MARREDEGYDWLNDPFDDKKSAEEQAGMSRGSKRALLIALVAAVIAIFALIALGLFSCSALAVW